MSGRFTATVCSDNFMKRSIGKEHGRRLQAYDAEGGGPHIRQVPAGELPSDRAMEELFGGPQARASHGLRATDVTSKQNCAYVKWFQHDSSDDTPERRSRRLQASGAAQGRSSQPLNNTLLGGGHSDFVSWRTSTGAAYAPPEAGGSVLPAAGLSPWNGTISHVNDRLNPPHGRRATEITTKQNCAYVKWYQHDTNDESPMRMSRRLEHGAREKAQPSPKTGAAVPNVLLGGSQADPIPRPLNMMSSGLMPTGTGSAGFSTARF
eukprot:CAMPEP_0179356916 /NCGR_PEP_ID=MMETSP0797-20121207/78136_1 /TAXON_ID=47934 /ORGANISM="Dinophysis acuminata, Strain DAEP01" /LENGTH=263 /DNA_ID=CAMNT_0021072111 /DNA_START=28 /DNA_END=819 /DNA_ORIENTATION=+